MLKIGRGIIWGEESMGTLMQGVGSGVLPKCTVAATSLLQGIYYRRQQQQQLLRHVCLLLSVQTPLLRNPKSKIPSG